MSEQISKALLKIINDISDTESTISKIDGAIFVRNNEKIINEKVAYLYNLLQAEAKFYDQNQDVHSDDMQLIISHYKQKLNMVYTEFYTQYVNIQNEIQEARLNQKIAMINFQKIINNRENALKSREYQEFTNKKQMLVQKLKLANNKSEYDNIYKEISELKSPVKNIEELKTELKAKNELYEKIIEKCNQKFGSCKIKFENQINHEFLIASSLQVVDENNWFEKVKKRLINFFTGFKKYEKILKEYHKRVDKIDEREIMEEMRNDTIDFITEILELRSFGNNSLENVG